jgi:hypothetical protein
MTTIDRIRSFIQQSKHKVFLRSDFVAFGSSTQVGRAISVLVDKRGLVRISPGAYVRTRRNLFTGELRADGNLEEFATELFWRLGITVRLGALQREYNKHRGLQGYMQRPTEVVIDTGNRRITRKITVSDQTVKYENNLSE